ncbi:MAG: nitroreductase family protein [Bacteroides sp.]|nr:nitroreductase family protein [Bacteroides sp.]MCM1549121.1 nitroreductase family protein [Clostridium sp.]
MNNTVIYTRRSIRKFQNKNVSKEIIKSIIDAGRMAPSAKNRQPWKYIVYGGRTKDELLTCMEQGILREEQGTPLLPNSGHGIADAKNTLKIMREAPIIVIVLNTNGSTPFSEIDTEHRFTEICDSLSIGASIENILLKAEEIGIGTLWIANTCFSYPELTAYLDTKHQLVGAIAVGYADKHPMQRPRKELSDILEFRL